MGILVGSMLSGAYSQEFGQGRIAGLWSAGVACDWTWGVLTGLAPCWWTLGVLCDYYCLTPYRGELVASLGGPGYSRSWTRVSNKAVEIVDRPTV